MSQTNNLAPNSNPNTIPPIPLVSTTRAHYHSQRAPSTQQLQRVANTNPNITFQSLSNSTPSYKDVTNKLSQFIQSYKQCKNQANFDHNSYLEPFAKILETIKKFVNNSTEQHLKDWERELSPLLAELITDTIPPNFGYRNTNNDEEKKNKVNKNIDIKIQILQWIMHSKYLHYIQMQYIIQMLRHSVYKENESVAIHLYENILIPRIQKLRSSYRQYRQQAAKRSISQHRQTPSNIQYHSGKFLFEQFMGEAHSHHQYLKALNLLIQIVLDATKKLQDPVAWIKRIHPAKTDEKGTKWLAALDSHSFMVTPLQNMKYLFWIIEASIDVGEYYENYIAKSNDSKMAPIQAKCNNTIDFIRFKDHCKDMNIVFRFLEAIIGVYRITDDTLKDTNPVITKIRIHWLSVLVTGLHYMYTGWGNTAQVCKQRDAKYWNVLKVWERQHIPIVIQSTFKHVASIRDRCSNQDYCKFLKVIATKCTQLNSFNGITAKDHFKFICDSTLFLGTNYEQEAHNRIPYASLCLNESTITKFNKQFWFYNILCAYWVHACPSFQNRQWVFIDFKAYSCSETYKGQIFDFRLVQKSISILLSIIRNQNNSSTLQQYAIQALTALIRFVQAFRSKYVENNNASLLTQIYKTFNTLKWVLEGKLDDIDKELDNLFKTLHVKQYQIYSKKASHSHTMDKNPKKRTFSEFNDANDAIDGNTKRRKLMSDGKKEDEKMNIDEDDEDVVIMPSYELQQEEDIVEPWIDNDYTQSKRYEITTQGIVELEPQPIQVHGDEHSNPDWIIYEIENLTQLIFRCVRYCRIFEGELKRCFQQSKARLSETEYNIYSDVQIHRTCKAFGTHLRLLRIYSVPTKLLPHLHYKTKDEIIDQGLMSFVSQLTAQQARSVWAQNMQLLIKLAEAYPNSAVYSNALKNCCKTASKLLAQQMQNNNAAHAHRRGDHQNIAIKSFIACDAYLGYLLANLGDLLGDDDNEQLLLTEFYNDPQISQYAAIQFIERHFYNSTQGMQYIKKYKNNKNGYGFIIHYDLHSETHIRIPTCNGFILPPFVEEERFTLFAQKYVQFRKQRMSITPQGSSSNHNIKMDVDEADDVNDMVSYLDHMSDEEFKSMTNKEKAKKEQFASTRWVQLERHEWIIDTTEHVIRSLFKLFMQIHQLNYPHRPNGSAAGNATWKGLAKLYQDAQQMITHYAKELIFKCITLSFKTAHCFAYIRLLQQIMTKCIENQFVGLLVPYINFIIPSLVSLSNNKSWRFNNHFNLFQFESDNSMYKILSFIPREFQHILCKAGECSLIVTTDTSMMDLPYIQQLMIPILNGLKLENMDRYPDLMDKSLIALNSWFESLTIPSIEALLDEYGDELCRSLCAIIQMGDNDTFKTQAIRALGKLGGNNRKFLETASSMKHEKSTLQSITLDFTINHANANGNAAVPNSNTSGNSRNQPNIIDISFCNIIDEALNLILQEPNVSLSTPLTQENTNNHNKRLAAMKTIRNLITTLVWNEQDYNSKQNNIQIPVPVYHKMHLLKNYDLTGNANVNTPRANANGKPNVVVGPETIENYKSYQAEKIVRLSEEKLKSAIMAIMIACADNDLSENRDYLNKLSKHFALLYSTQPIQEFLTEQEKDQHIYINIQSSKYLTSHLHCDIYLDAIVTVLMAQNTLWKYSANVTLIQLLDSIDHICFKIHLLPSFKQKAETQRDMHNAQKKKYWIIIRHILKQLEHHVIHNTDSVLDGVVMGLTTISFKIQNKAEILTWDLIEEFLMTSIKAARHTFIQQNDDRRHRLLHELTRNFLDHVYNTLSMSKGPVTAIDTFKKLGCMVTKMHLVPIGSRELMYKILDQVQKYTKCNFVDFVPVQLFIDGLMKNSTDSNDKKAPSRLCGFYETAAWASSTTPPILQIDHQIVPFLQIAARKLGYNIRPEQSAFLSADARVDPMTKAMNKFLEQVKDYSSNIKLKTLLASIRFISCALSSSYWLKIKPQRPPNQNANESTKWLCLNALIEQLISCDELIFNETYLALQRLNQYGTKIAEHMALEKNQTIFHCSKALENFATCCDPVKIKVIETLYRLFGPQWDKSTSTCTIEIRLVVHFREWLKHFNVNIQNSYTILNKTVPDAQIPVLLTSFFQYIPEMKANDDEISEVDPKTSKVMSSVDKILDYAVETITNFELKQLWPYISCYVMNSCNTINPLHRSIVPFLNKYPAKAIEYFMKFDTNVERSRYDFYRQQLFLSILSLSEAQPIRKYFKNAQILRKYIVETFTKSSILIQNYLIKILIIIGEFEKGWLKEIHVSVLHPIITVFSTQITKTNYEKLDFVADILEFPSNVIKCFIYGYDTHIDAQTLSRLSACFNQLSYVDHSYFYTFLHKTLPQKTSIVQRQRLVSNLLKVIFDTLRSKTTPNTVLTSLQYVINGIASGCNLLKLKNTNKQNTIWTLNNYELSNYLMRNTLEEDQLLKFDESIRSEFIILICGLMKRCDPNWFRQNKKINSSMWSIYKNKTAAHPIGIGSRLHACQALLIIAKYYGDQEFLKQIGEHLRPLLEAKHEFCCSYLVVLQSIFTDYIGLQIKSNCNVKQSSEIFDKWLRDFIVFIIEISNPELIWKSAVHGFLKHREALGKYWNHIFLLYRTILREFCHMNFSDVSFSFRILMLESIRVYSQWIKKYSAIQNKMDGNKQLKLKELCRFSWQFIFYTIHTPAKMYLPYTQYLSTLHHSALAMQYALTTATDLVRVSSGSPGGTYSHCYNGYQNQTWQYQYGVITSQLNDTQNMPQKHLGTIANVYHCWCKQITILRIINLLLKPMDETPRSMNAAIESFTRYDYDKIAELFASITCSIPLSRHEFEKLNQFKKASLHHSKYWFFNYDEMALTEGDRMTNTGGKAATDASGAAAKAKMSGSTDHNNHSKKISRVTIFMDCDEIYYEEMTNLTIRLASFAKYLSETKHSEKSNHNGERLMMALKDLKLHHAFHTKIMNGFQKMFIEYGAKCANVESHGNNNYLTQVKNAKVVIVMNCQLFRFWEPMFKSSLMGAKQTVRLLSYLVFFGEIIFEDYKFRIQKLARLVETQASAQVTRRWEQHIAIFCIPLMKSITRIVCINCRKSLKEFALVKPWDSSSNNHMHAGHHHHHHHRLKTFYHHFTLMFASLFQSKIQLRIHNDLLFSIGSMVRDRLIRSSFFNECDLKLKLIESMRCSFPKHAKLEDIYVDSVAFVLDGIQNNQITAADIARPIYMCNGQNSFVKSFLTCLCLPNVNARYKFRDYMKRNTAKTFFDRLGLIYGGADWLEIGDKYWLTPGLDLILDLFDGESNINLHHPSAKSLQPIKYYDNFETNALKLINLSDIKELHDIVLFEQQMLYKRATLKSFEILAPLTEWMYYSPAIAQNIWLQIIVSITEKLSDIEHADLLDNLHTMLLIDTDIGFEAYHLSRDADHECCDPLKSIMKGISLNAPQPFPDFGWNIITRCAYYHSCWFECLDIINNYLQRILAVPQHTTKFRAAEGYDVIETHEFSLVADLFDDLYRKLGADDICTTFWKTRSTYKGTLCALTLKQFGYWDRVHHELWKCQQKQKKCPTLRVSQAEGRLWQKDWLLACKKLGHWAILEQRANDQKIPSLQLESQCHLGHWYDFNRLLEFHDEARDDPDHCGFKSYLYQLYSELSRAIAPNGFNFDEMDTQTTSNNYRTYSSSNIKSDRLVDIIGSRMPRIISRSFKKLPQFIAWMHWSLLHECHLFVEIEEGIECLDETRALFGAHRVMSEAQRQLIEEPIKKVVNRWRQRLPNIYEGLDIWSDIFSFRVNCFEFASYYQKQAERNSLVFHDRAWTIIQLSKHGRNSACYNSALLILSKIMSMKRMDARDFYLRIKEQVAIAKMNKESSSSIQRALHILNIANLKYFTELQKSELFSIKAEIKQKLQLLDDSNASYSASLAIAGDNWKAWTKWGDFCDSIYSAKQDYRWAMYAMISYLCSLHGGDELTRAYWPDNLMNPIHPHYPKSTTHHHSAYAGGRQHHQPYTDDVLQKHGDPEKDLEHSNYHHLVIPRILRLIQAAKLGPEDVKEDDVVKEDKEDDKPPHIDEKGEQKAIPTRENSEFIRYLYDGVMKLPPHVFLGYIPQLISGLYRYEADASYLILNDHIRFVAPQLLFYYVYHYKRTHETSLLGNHMRKYRQYVMQHQHVMDNIKASLASVHDAEQRRKLQREMGLYATRIKQFETRADISHHFRSRLEAQHSYQQMLKIHHNLVSSKDSHKLQSIIAEQEDLMPRLKKFGNDVNQRNTKLLNLLNPLRQILHNILQENPSGKQDNPSDFASFICEETRVILTTIRLFKRHVSATKHNATLHDSILAYANQFESDFGWVIKLRGSASSQQLSLAQEYSHKRTLFDTAFLWYKHITSRIGIIERSLSKLKALYGSDLNFYEPAQEIFCPGFIGKTLFRRKPRTDNLPKYLDAAADAAEEENKSDNDLWSMDAPTIIRILPKLFLLPATYKEFYILCNDGVVRCYRMYENVQSNKESSMRAIRDQQLVRFCNQLFKSNRETRKRYLCQNHISKIVPCDIASIFYEFNPNEISFAQIVNRYCTQNNLDQIRALSTYLHKLQQNPGQKEAIFVTMQKEYFADTMLDDFVAKSLIGSSFKLHCTTAEFFEFKKRFAKSLAFHNLWLLCWRTPNRDLSQYYLRMDTGELICRGDFGTNLAIFNSRITPNPFPLRVTPNLNYLLQPNLLHSYFTLSLSTMASVIINNGAFEEETHQKEEEINNEHIKYLRHFLYIHFREAKLQMTKRNILNPTGVNFPDHPHTIHNNNPLYQLLDRQLLNQDFKWMQELERYAAVIADKMKTLSYPVFGEPPFSFRNYEPKAEKEKATTNASSAKSNSNAQQKDDEDTKRYIQPMQRVTKMVNDAKSIKVCCQMPPSWNPFF